MARISALAAFAVATALSCSLAQAQDASGSWVTQGGKSVVRISGCGAALCGKIVSLKEPNDAEGKPKLDSKNQDKSKRTRPIVGVAILNGMKKDKDNRWAGDIYNPEDGKTYKAYMTLEAPSKLLVEGCVLGGLVCKKQRWSKQ